MEADRFPIEGGGTGGDKSQLPVLPSPAWLPLVAVGGGAWAGGDTGPDSGTVTRPRHQAAQLGQDRGGAQPTFGGYGLVNPPGKPSQ